MPLGTQAELWAQNYLEQRVLKKVKNNFRTAQGEIDLIMYDKETLIFVEVRLRSTNSHGSAKESISCRKQQRILKAAHAYLQTEGLWDKVQCRFDAICLDLDPDNSNQYQVEWIPSAFSPSI
jgi:putative endonuclease